MDEKQFTATKKLQLLLDHWLQHNKSHVVEYQEWTEVARQAGLSETADFIQQAVSSLKKADNALAKALTSAGGSPKKHQHHQHE